MNPQSAQDYQNMYRQYRNTIQNRAGQNPAEQQPKANDGDLKNFHLRATVKKDSVSAKTNDQQSLVIGFEVDAQVDAYIRVNACVTEKKNPNNVPEMFYTPHKDGFVQEKRLKAGNNQQVEVEFSLNFVAGYELFATQGGYYPLIISINYQENKQPYAMISYCVFTKNGNNDITGLRVLKQVVLINGLPFEIKSIYGMVEDDNAEEGEA